MLFTIFLFFYRNRFETNGFDYLQRLSLRLYLLLRRQPELLDRPFPLHNGDVRCIRDMESNAKDILNTQQFQGIINYFIFYDIKDYDPELLLKVYGILQCNAFGIDCYDGGEDNDRDVLIESRGSGLYIEASVFDHDCVPNACASGDGLNLEIRALRNISPGEKITIDYLQDVLPREERQTMLQERYFFKCQCLQGCKEAIDGPRFDDLVDYKRLEVLNKVIAKFMENFVQPSSQELVASGIQDQNLIAKLLRKDLKFDNWGRLLECWKKRLELQEVFYSVSGFHPCLSLFYREFLLLNLYLVGQLEQMQKHQEGGSNSSLGSLNRTSIEKDIVLFGDKARRHLTITHGVEHIFYAKLFSRNQTSQP